MFSKVLVPGLIFFVTVGSCPPVAADQVAEDEKRLSQENLKTDAASLLEFFKSRTVRIGQDQVKSLVNQLSSRSFSTRQKAGNTLRDLGARAVPQLKEALKHPELEVRRRAEEILRDITSRSRPEIIEASARLLALRQPAGAAEALLDFLPSVLEYSAIRELHSALAKLAVRGGKIEPALLRALTDEFAVRRAAAVVALCQAGGKDHLERVKPLLRDPEPLVRLHTALSLLALHEKESVPVLIGLFENLSRNQLWQAEDALYRLAGEHAPSVALGETAQSRKEFRDAWLKWWAGHSDKLDLAALLKDTRRDWTLVVLLDEGVVLELDAKDRERFRMEKIAFPLDAQTLPGDRVLLAEHGGGRITERLRDGTVLWEKKATEPLAAQRLDNGNTFIATKERIMEVDREGKEVFSWSPGLAGEEVMRAKKLTDGTYAIVLHDRQRYVRVDRQGKEMEGLGLNVNIQTFGGRIDVLPNGNVLIPQMYANRVIEFDPRGKVVQEFSVGQPIVATRLPNGNTLMTSMNENRAVEIDQSGKKVWEYRATTRVTRVYRR